MNEPKKYRTVIIYKKNFEDFFLKQKQKVREKIACTFLLIEEIQQVPETYLKHIKGTEGIKKQRAWRIQRVGGEERGKIISGVLENK